MDSGQRTEIDTQKRPPPFMKENGQQYKVAIGIPSEDTVFTDFALCLGSLIIFGGAHYGVFNQRGCYVHDNRDFIVNEAKKWGADYLFFIDTDIIAPPNTILRLLSHKKPVAGATYVKRRSPHPILGATFDSRLAIPAHGLHRFAELPTGCMLIDMKVFDTIADGGPHFRTPVINGKTKGEDIDFCHRCLEKDVHIFCDIDLSLELAHIGVKKYNIVEAQQGMYAPPKPRGTEPTPVDEIPVPVPADG